VIKTLNRWLGLAATATLFAGAASGYYHFVRYNSFSGPFTAIPEKFDLASLPSKTITFYISENAPAAVAPNDSVAGVISQIRAAARVWNDVSTSDLRLAFGGMFPPGTPHTTPGIEVTFDDLPPGLVGLGGPTVKADQSSGPNGDFVPIIRSVVVLPRDLSSRPSFSERFFKSAVHEFGHTLGLQHTLTSSAMSTEVTRATTKARPLTIDDIAGISLLYPTAQFLEGTGSVSGRVTLDGSGVNLASVVALSPSGIAISALTHPDGTYLIDGVPQGQYYVYAHALPPAVRGESTPNNMIFPLDSHGAPIPASGPFDTLFYPGSRLPQQSVTVSAQAVTEGIDFAVRGRASQQIYGVETYSFPAQVDVKPAFLSFVGSRSFIVVRGAGLTANGALVPDLKVSAIGGSAITLGTQAYAQDFIQVDFQLNSFAGAGRRHLIFSRDDEVYVLPGGLTVTERAPPSITSITASTDQPGRIALISGTNLSAETRILFDGAEALVRSVDGEGRLVVTPPYAPIGHTANVVALNADGQSSLFLHGNNPPAFTYEPLTETVFGAPAGAASFALEPSTLPAGIEAMVEIIGSGTNFIEGQTSVGFGTSDLSARRVWVLSPTRLLVNVKAASSAPLIATTVSVTTGLHVITQPFAFQVQAANPVLPVVNSKVLHGRTRKQVVQAGEPAIVTVSNLASGTVSITLNDIPARILAVEGSEIRFEVPAGISPGPAVLRLRSGGETSLPVVIAIEPPSPVISGALSSGGFAVDANRPARPGDLLTLVVTGLSGRGEAVPAARVHVTGGDLEHQVVQVVPAASQPGAHQVLFILSPLTPLSGPVNLTVSINDRASLPISVPVRSL
jgi:uncharacterized protein (TIGR03437 family)